MQNRSSIAAVSRTPFSANPVEATLARLRTALAICSVSILTAALLASEWVRAALQVEKQTLIGKTVDRAGRAVAGVELAKPWKMEEGNFHGVVVATSASDGRFSLPWDGKPATLMALDKERKRGAIVTIDKNSGRDDITVELSNLISVKGSFTCKELNDKIQGAVVFVHSRDGGLIVWQRSPNEDFAFLLPPGEYRLEAGGADFRDVASAFSVTSAQPAVVLKPLEVAATEIARYRGKPPPFMHIGAARGAKKDITLAEFKGKWVLVEFFYYNCVPCVVRSLPSLVDFYEEYESDRDKFEIIAVHVQHARDLADYDEKMKHVIKNIWHGKDLPFPVLLDPTKKTMDAFGIQSFPTTILIDPSGNLVGHATEADLEKKLPAVPPATQLPRILDRRIGFSVNEPILQTAVDQLAKLARTRIEFDHDALQKKGISSNDKVPLTIGNSMSLRSALNLLLAADGLTYTAGENGFLVQPRKGKPKDEALSIPQKAAAKRIAKALETNVTFHLKPTTLAAAADVLGEAAHECVVLDPAARRAGALDPNRMVGVDVEGKTLGEAFGILLKPVGLTLEVRDEVILITPKK
jgi:cytochrome oxidase Cu insertion factor (SCO1/SenC/PrrC family)